MSGDSTPVRSRSSSRDRDYFPEEGTRVRIKPQKAKGTFVAHGITYEYKLDGVYESHKAEEIARQVLSCAYKVLRGAPVITDVEARVQGLSEYELVKTHADSGKGKEKDTGIRIIGAQIGYNDDHGTHITTELTKTVFKKNEKVQKHLTTLEDRLSGAQPIPFRSNATGDSDRQRDGLGSSTAGSKPNTSPTTTTIPSTTLPPLPDRTISIDRRRDICKGRGVKAPTSASAALAHQLFKMPKAKGTYEISQVVAIDKRLRKEVAKHIEGKDNYKNTLTFTSHWMEDSNFEPIFAALKSAYDFERRAIPPIATLSTLANQKIKDGTSTKLDSLLTNMPKSRADRKQLVEIYCAYLRTNSPYLDKAFFEAFVELNNKNDNFFQVVVIDSSSEKVTPYVSSDESTIDPTRCAFLQYDSTTGMYSSYKRGSEKGGLIPDLNTLTDELSMKPVERKLPAARNGIPFISTNSLENSIAYMDFATIYGRSPVRSEYELRAQQLRQGVAGQITRASLQTNEKFVDILCESIELIPAFSATISGEEKKLSEDLMRVILQNSHDFMTNSISIATQVQTLKSILEKRKNGKGLSPNEVGKLQEFYQLYMLQKDKEDKLSNPLGPVFLHIISGNNKRIILIKEDKLHKQYQLSENLEIDLNNTIFVIDNGNGTYNAVDMTSATPQMSAIIEDLKDAVLRKLYETPPANLKAYIEETLHKQYPDASKSLIAILRDNGKDLDAIDGAELDGLLRRTYLSYAALKRKIKTLA